MEMYQYTGDYADGATLRGCQSGRRPVVIALRRRGSDTPTDTVNIDRACVFAKGNPECKTRQAQRLTKDVESVKRIIERAQQTTMRCAENGYKRRITRENRWFAAKCNQLVEQVQQTDSCGQVVSAPTTTGRAAPR